MQQELKRIHQEVGVTFVYVTHDQEEALTMSDRIAVMNSGRIEQLDTPSAIYERPSSSFVADFIGMMNVMRGVVERHEDRFIIVRTGDGYPPSRCDNAMDIRREKRWKWQCARKKSSSVSMPQCLAENCLEGRVAQIVYQGASTEYYVALASGSRLRVVAQNTSADAGEALAHRGAPVFVHWATNATLVMVAAAADMAKKSEACASG